MDIKTIALIEASLPLSLEPLVKDIGLKHTLALVEKYGGMVFVPPRRHDGPGSEKFAEIEGVIGFDATCKLGKLYDGDKFSVPKCQDARRACRNAQLVQDFDALTARMSSAKAVNELAALNDLSFRQVEQIINGKTQVNPQRRPCQVVRNTAGASAAHTPAAPAKSPAAPTIHGCPTAHTVRR